MGRRWQKLHRLVYVAAILGCVHFWWQVKADVREPLVYAAIAAVLLGWRLHRHRRRRAMQAQGSGPLLRARGHGTERDAGQDQHAAGAGAPVQLLAKQPPAEA